jgi:replicative DNA helicase
MATALQNRTKKFREDLTALGRDKLMNLLYIQDPDLVKQVNRIEWVFENKLTHLTWPDGTPVEGRPVTDYELALLVDEPFTVDPQLTEMGISAEEQRRLHVAKDPVMWAREMLGAKPRVYQILMLRHPSMRKVLRAGRRLGKTWTMAVTLLHYSYITTNGRSIVVTPFKQQGGLIYEQIMKMATEDESNEMVGKSITRHVTSPQYEIVFANGSTIRFFSSGVKSGGKSDVTRGQEAHLIILDELDYMGQDDLVALYAMLQQTDDNQTDKLLMGASTPSGRQEMFWEWCLDKSKGFTEFWYPSYANPFFKKELEDEMRGRYSEMQYRHEIEADWGENAEGVYPRRFLERAFINPPWDYEDAKKSGTSFFVMGVDWNKYQAGTNIVVLEVCDMQYREERFRNKVKLAYREEVPQEEFTYTRAMERIKELNKRFNPEWIYVDRGYGEVQIEELHKYGIAHPNTRLREKVKGIGFKTTIEVPDPMTGHKEKKEMKPFMVENLRRFLEREQLLIPFNDVNLFAELIGYIVIRTSAAGVPVFGASGSAGDNVHDALVLALLAITQNYDDIMTMQFATGPVVVSNSNFMQLSQAMPNDDKLESRYGSDSPVLVQRAMASAKTRTGPRPYRRKMF